MDLPWYTYLVPKYQTRYSSLIKWKYYPILGKHIENLEDIIGKDISEVINDKEKKPDEREKGNHIDRNNSTTKNVIGNNEYDLNIM